ncbi:hypothetical protein O3P69_016349 [Scylla paramamosain]|uniref:Uncharacterized protein n=1 Tax=Scylla paramamosain TaxID=85552 RepID=A0AAW0TCR2_SCYPA
MSTRRFTLPRGRPVVPSRHLHTVLIPALDEETTDPRWSYHYLKEWREEVALRGVLANQRCPADNGLVAFHPPLPASHRRRRLLRVFVTPKVPPEGLTQQEIVMVIRAMQVKGVTHLSPAAHLREIRATRDLKTSVISHQMKVRRRKGNLTCRIIHLSQRHSALCQNCLSEDIALCGGSRVDCKRRSLRCRNGSGGGRSTGWRRRWGQRPGRTDCQSSVSGSIGGGPGELVVSPRLSPRRGVVRISSLPVWRLRCHLVPSPESRRE